MSRFRLLAWGALALWTAVSALLIPLAGRSGEIVSKDPALLLPRSSEATRALLAERLAFPGADTPEAVVVYVRATGLTPADRAAADADRTAFAALAKDGRIAPTAVSADGQALLVSFPLRKDGDPEAVVKRVKAGLEDAPPGLETAVTGSAGALSDISDAVGGTDTTLLLSAALVVAILLLITYRSPSMWILPLFAVGLASQIATGIVFLLGKHAGVTVTEDATALMLIMVFGVGTDYALLLIARYREELYRHEDRFAAMAVAVRHSFPAILASAGTVTVGMLCLLAARMNDVRGFGPIAAAGIVVAFAVMTTLLPALLVLLGRWVFWPFVPRAGRAPKARSRAGGVWERAAALVDRRPRRIWVLSTLALAVLSLGVLGFRPGLTAEQTYTEKVGSVVGQELIAQHYPGGASGPARIIVPVDSAGAVSGAAKVRGVASVGAPVISADGRTARIDAVLADPPDSEAAKDTVDRLRNAFHGTGALVGGQTATTLDVERASHHDNLVVPPLILVVVLAVLVLLLRAVVAPILLAASVVLSFAAAMGAAGLLMQLLGHPHFIPSLPLYGFLFLVTLGIDYTIFLMTRAREEVAVRGHRQGVLTALTVTGGVITSAGIVLAATFATLITLPIVMALQIGAIVAIGVLLDTLVVRTLLIPALIIDVGDRVWWPGRRNARPPAERLSRDAVDLVG
ncbi:MMPL family transporter [Actinocorallia herbida]|uniref:MMPL family transporter n=1 Tax=Actinocorallia herbida TaxID=58109 RepID=UPI001476DC75|nr:MMPL family transporter [Actinocorallia herbida]